MADKKKTSELTTNSSPSPSATLVGVEERKVEGETIKETVQIPITEFVTKDENENIGEVVAKKIRISNGNASDSSNILSQDDGRLVITGTSGIQLTTSHGDAISFYDDGSGINIYTNSLTLGKVSQIVASTSKDSDYESSGEPGQVLTSNGVGDLYWGDAPSGGSPMTDITYAELKALRDGGNLIPGMFYRITDYQCTTVQADTRATDHRFDIIVQALSNNKLSETAKADYNADDSYFADNNANLSAWEIKYCLDNDTTRFAWALDDCQAITNLNTGDSNGAPLIRQPSFDGGCYREPEYQYAWGVLADLECSDPGCFVYSKNATVVNGELVYNANDGEFQTAQVVVKGQAITNLYSAYSNGRPLVRQPSMDGRNSSAYESFHIYNYAWGTQEDVDDDDGISFVYSLNPIITNGEAVFNASDGELQTAEVIEGKGVIYYMKDEHGNECPYDFKNIQFKRYVTTINGYPELDYQTIEEGGTDPTWVYTFCGNSYHIDNDEWSELKDGSLESPYQHESDEGSTTFQNNTIKPYYVLYDGENEDYTKCGKQHLNNNVFFGYWEEIGSTDPENCPYYYAKCCCNNKLGDNCNNTFGNNCSNNTFGNNCYNNTFGNECNNNTFLDYSMINYFALSCKFSKIEGASNNFVACKLFNNTLNKSDSFITSV
jgi:hypothetical protein